tara:strand:+ start:133 stop:552 length:420 start_codon:yes stop_codon:yes gene_type:complete
MSFFVNPPPNCKIYEGKTCIPSLRTFISQLPDTIEDGTIHGSPNKWKLALLKDFNKIEKQNHLAYGRGQMGIQISAEGRVMDYTWSFGQKTTRRLKKWCEQRVTAGSTLVAVTIHSWACHDKEDCIKQSFAFDESVEEE